MGMSAFSNIPQPMKAGLDFGLVGYVVVALAGAAPAIGAVLVAIYYFIQIWESQSVVKLRLWLGAKLVRSFTRFAVKDALSKGAPVSVEVQPVIVVGPVPPQPPVQSPAAPEPAKPA